jgi:hypothetical protein
MTQCSLLTAAYAVMMFEASTASVRITGMEVHFMIVVGISIVFRTPPDYVLFFKNDKKLQFVSV